MSQWTLKLSELMYYVQYHTNRSVLLSTFSTSCVLASFPIFQAYHEMCMSLHLLDMVMKTEIIEGITMRTLKL